MRNIELDEELKNIAGQSYGNSKIALPKGWEYIGTSINNETGFRCDVYKKGNDIAISFAGTDIKSIHDIENDALMGLGAFPSQLNNANDLYKQIITKYPNENIIFTGHSLGGSLAQLMSAKTGDRAVTFNAYGTGNILLRDGYTNLSNMNITNYGNYNDYIFGMNYQNQPGKTFVLSENSNLDSNKIYGANLEIGFHNPITAHDWKNIGALKNAVEIEPSINFKNNTTPVFKANIQENIYLNQSPNPVLKGSVEENVYSTPKFTKEDIAKMSTQDFQKNEKQIMKQLRKKGFPIKSQTGKKSSSGEKSKSGDGHWVTINSNHVFIED